jgi:phage terminase small subunit
MELTKLSNKQKLFVSEYIANKFNAGAAAVAAGYSPGGARAWACHLLGDPLIQEELAKQQAALARRVEITQEMVVEELRRVGFSNIRDYLSFDANGVCLRNSEEIPEDKLAAVAEVSETTALNGGSIRLKLHNKLEALNGICRVLGFNAPEKKEHTGPGGGPIVTEELSNLTPEDRQARIDELIAKRGT